MSIAQESTKRQAALGEYVAERLQEKIEALTRSVEEDRVSNGEGRERLASFADAGTSPSRDNLANIVSPGYLDHLRFMQQVVSGGFARLAVIAEESLTQCDLERYLILDSEGTRSMVIPGLGQFVPANHRLAAWAIENAKSSIIRL